MKKNPALFIMTIATLLAHSAMAQVEPKPVALSAEQQIRLERAKAAREEAQQPTNRPWDRDANGKRPWDIKPDVSK